MKRILILALSFVWAVSPVAAQELETGYFLGGNPYAFRLNPAFQSERNILSVALGQTGLGAWSNLGVSALLYPDSNGYLYTFLNDRVDTQSFLQKIGKSNVLDADARVNVLTIGFWKGSSFMTIDINVRSQNAVSLPYDLFSFWKGGTTGQSSFDLSGMGLRSKSFVEAAFGWSRNYDNVFNVGFRAKALVGALEAEAIAKNLKLSSSGGNWTVQAESYLNASSPSLAYSRDGEYLDLESLNLGSEKYGPAGYGAAIDLGASWNVLPDLTLSASVLDLGAIRWNREVRGHSPESSYTWAPEEGSHSGQQDWEAEINDAMEQLSGLLRFKDVSGSEGEKLEMMPFQVLLGAEYRMPFYNRLSVGALYTGRGGACFARNSGRLSLNWNPLDFLSLSTSATLNRLGESFGFAFNLHPGGINLLVGCDYVPVHVVNISSMIDNIPPQYEKLAVIPRDQMKLNLYLGLNLAFGKSRLDHSKGFRYNF